MKVVGKIVGIEHRENSRDGRRRVTIELPHDLIALEVNENLHFGEMVIITVEPVNPVYGSEALSKIPTAEGI